MSEQCYHVAMCLLGCAVLVAFSFGWVLCKTKYKAIMKMILHELELCDPDTISDKSRLNNAQIIIHKYL